LFVPFEDGESILFHDDDEKCLEEIKRISPSDVENWKDMKEFVARCVQNYSLVLLKSN